MAVGVSTPPRLRRRMVCTASSTDVSRASSSYTTHSITRHVSRTSRADAQRPESATSSATSAGATPLGRRRCHAAARR
ncbi:hypothetical protein NFJ02_16g24990 [Pycnococcus provasolii]